MLWHPRHWGTWLAALFIGALGFLPVSIKAVLSRFIGGLCLRYYRRGAAFVDLNLKLCFPQLDDAERQAIRAEYFNNWARVWLDVGLHWWGASDRLLALAQVSSLEQVKASLAEGKSVILLVNHQLALEMAGLVLAEQLPMLAFVKSPSNPVLAYLTLRGRQRRNTPVLSRNDGMRVLIKALRKGRVLFYLADQDFAGADSLDCDFFGYQRPTLKTLNRLAKLANAQIYPLNAKIINNNYQLDIGSRIEAINDPMSAARVVNNHLQQSINDAPSQYLLRLPLFRGVAALDDVYSKITN